jgi:glucuronate isomerase
MERPQKTKKWTLSPDRCFHPDPAQRDLARQLYATVKDLPLICPHGHVPAALLADPEARLGTPAELFIIPDHYIFRMLYSQGIALDGPPSWPGVERSCRCCFARPRSRPFRS